MPGTENTQETERARALAHSLDCLLVEDICVLYDVNDGTAETWRKRGSGPAYIRAGNRFLYPRQSVADDLKARARERRATTSPKDLL